MKRMWDFLKPEYDDEIDMDDLIEIKDGKYSRSEVLKEMDAERYDATFLDWIDDRLEQRLSKAESILDLFDNRDRFVQLKQAYQRSSVIPFVGAGMTVPSGYKSWTSFLFYLQEHSRVPKGDLEALIKDGNYEEAAQALYDDIGAPSFNEILNNTYGISREVVGPIQYLPFLFDSAVVTTNFDPILKIIYEVSSIGFEEVLIGGNAEDFPALLGAGKRILLKLHGDAARERNRILTLNEYNRAYSNEDALNSLIEDALFNKTLLFIGCSLTIDRTLIAMRDFVERKGHERCTRHYCFIPLPEEEDRLDVRDRLVPCNIYPIWYPISDHDESIEALFLKLLED